MSSLRQNSHVVVSHAAPAKLPTFWRWALASAGILCFGMGMVGAILPGMPTTVFLLVGSFCLTKSCPWLEQRLLNTRLLRPYARFVNSREPMSRRARSAAISAMSICILISGTALYAAGKMSVGLLAGFVAMWLAGLVSILLFRRAK